MTTTYENRYQVRTTLLAAAVILLLLALVATLASATDDASSRLNRKVQVMERVIDEVLTQSPNVVVGSARGVTRGLVLADYGAVFIFDGQLGTGQDVYFGRPMRGITRIGGDETIPGFYFRTDENEEILTEKLEEMKKKQEQELEAMKKKREQQLADLQSELTDTLIDYGPTLTELGDNQWVTIVAFLDGEYFFHDSSPTRLVLKARMKDLRDHASGSLARDGVARKVVVELKDE